MLSPLDDYPVHQISEPMRHVGTSDRNFYDRYYFNIHGTGDVHGTDEELFCVIGVGQYPNLGVADAFVSVKLGDDHRVVRSSKVLGADRMDASVGPIRVEVRRRGSSRSGSILEPNEWGIELDAVYDGFCEAHLEPRHFDRQFSRVIFDSTRFAQVGGWTGTLKVGDREVELTPDQWWGSRDRSWGIRPVGESEHPGIRVTDTSFGFFWVYAPVRFDDHAMVTIIQERSIGRADHAGRPPGFPMIGAGREADLAGPARARPPLRAGNPDGDRRHPLLLRRPGAEDGRDRGRDPAGLPPPAGFSGYGLEPDWKHGMYQGDLVTRASSRRPPTRPTRTGD